MHFTVIITLNFHAIKGANHILGKIAQGPIQILPTWDTIPGPPGFKVYQKAAKYGGMKLHVQDASLFYFGGMNLCTRKCHVSPIAQYRDNRELETQATSTSARDHL